jgi:hypothetical protein
MMFGDVCWRHDFYYRRLAETAEDDSSDTSTDSEDELDSPRKIIQQPPSENMDVDANDGKYIVIPTLLTLCRQWGRAELSS